jgi:NAD(P)-dependent dehydrogenase (short-subunit alcohol dehydrogenase family)
MAALMLEKPDDMLGKVCLVTGANAGIGKEIARGLALKRATVVVAARSEERGRAAAEEISDDTANPSVSFLKVDVSSRASVRAFAAELGAKHQKLDLLVNNAGVWMSERKESVDGIEMTWATNVLGYFLVTKLFQPLLEAAAPSRIVNVASNNAKGLDLADVEFKRRKYSGVAAYAQSKQADRMLSWAFADRLRAKKVTVNALHPGVVASEIAQDGTGAFGAVARVFFRVAGISPERGADTAVWLASSRGVAEQTSGYYVRRKEKRCAFRDEAEIEKLWALCEEMTRGAVSSSEG